MKLRMQVAGILLMVSSASGSAGGQSVVVGLQAWLDGTRDLTGRFEQRLVSGALGAGTVETGRLKLKRPGRMIWEYEHPEKKIATVQGDVTLLYLPEDRQMIRGRLSASQDLLPALLTGTSRLSELFVESVEPSRPEDPVGARRLKLVPRVERPGVEELVVLVRERDHAIQAAEVLDGAGNLVRYDFSDFKRNRGLPDNAFDLTPPPGTEILEQAPESPDGETP